MKLISLKKLFFLTCLLLGSKAYAVPFTPPRPEIRTLTNGLKLYLLTDHELPTFEASLIIPAGRLYDPPGKEGVALLTAAGLQSGGTLSRTPEKVEEELDFVGASLTIETQHEYQAITLHCLKKDAEKILKLLFDILSKPRFDKDRFTLAVSKVEEALRRQDEDPLERALREFPRLVFGPESPWASKPTHPSIKKIKQKDILNFYQQTFSPEGSSLAVSGDFDASEMSDLLEKTSKVWGAKKKQLPVVKPITVEFSPRTVLLPASVTQSTIIIGHLGDRRDNPDKFPLIVMNYILGGSGALTSRLGEEIRSHLGKAYLVWSDFGFGKDHGLFRTIAQTEVSNTAQVMEKIEEAITKMHRESDLTTEELERAKRSIVTALIFQYETRFQIVKQRALFDFLGYPPDYLEVYKREIEKITREDIQRVAGQYLHPDGLKILIVGPKEKLVPELKKVEVKESL
ncbi:MAG: pitrilysin family protein [Deltaproteobacteria bacterium]|nr:pitrilysin family protein [Deltaproteobacteria bacterium]